jgi:hypothetical protein
MDGVKTDFAFLIAIGALVLIAVFVIHRIVKASGWRRK